MTAQRADHGQHDDAAQRGHRDLKAARKRREDQQAQRCQRVDERHIAQRRQIPARRASAEPVTGYEHRTHEGQHVAQQAAVLAAHGEQADGRRADDGDNRAGDGLALDRLMQQDARQRRHEQRLRAHQRGGDEGGGEAHRRHPRGIVQREQQRRRAGQRELFFRRAQHGDQLAAFECGHEQQRRRDQHPPEGDHHGRRAAGQRPFDHRAGDAHAHHGQKNQQSLVLFHDNPLVQSASRWMSSACVLFDIIPRYPRSRRARALHRR